MRVPFWPFFRTKRDGQLPYLLLLWALSIPLLAPLFAPGYFYAAHDGRHGVFYQIMFDASIRDGAWWPRWAMHHIQGYGYPTFIIQAPLGFYVAELFVLLGAGYTVAIRFAWIAGFLVSGWGMYRLILHWLQLDEDDQGPGRLDHLIAVAAALFYLYAPYRLVDTYVRAALNDTLLLAWFPWVLLAFDRLIEHGTRPGWQRRLALAMASLGGVWLTHTFALISFTPLLVSFVLFRLFVAWQRDNSRPAISSSKPQIKDTWAPLRTTVLAVSAGIGGLLLTATFLLPLLVEAQHLDQQVYVANTYDYRNHFIQFAQFLSPFWGFGFSDDPTGANDGMSFQLGLILIIILILALYILFYNAETIWTHHMLIGYLTVATVVLLIIMTPGGAPLWDLIPALGIIQFPWRILSIATLTVSALGGMVVATLARRFDGAQLATDGKDAIGGVILIGVLAIYAGYGYIDANLQPVESWREDGRAIFRFEQEHPDMIAYTEWVEEPFQTSPLAQTYMTPDYREDYGPDSQLPRLAILRGDGEIRRFFSRGASGGGVVEMRESGVVRIHELYFPGWRVAINGRPVPFRISSPHGLLEVDVPVGVHTIEARMGVTPIRRTGTLLSWTMVGLLGVLWIWPVWTAWRHEPEEAVDSANTSTAE